jgi:hypothetical protein
MAETAQSPKRQLHGRRAGRSVIFSRRPYNRQEGLRVMNVTLVVSGPYVAHTRCYVGDQVSPSTSVSLGTWTRPSFLNAVCWFCVDVLTQVVGVAKPNECSLGVKPYSYRVPEALCLWEYLRPQA